jgi:hypothetical protein
MTTRHTISRADTLFSHNAYYPPANSVPGLPVDINNYFNWGGVAPAAAAANNICTSQASSGGTNALAINGALATAGVATPDVVRNVVAAWTTAAVITVTGTDFYGQPQTESAVSGTAFTGKKSFKTVTAVTFSTAVTAATVGTGVKLGLPYRVDANGLLDALTDNLPDVTYAFVPADTTSPATATTGDVRGTIAASTAPNGTHLYAVNFRISDRTGGVGRIVGAYGVTPA